MEITNKFNLPEEIVRAVANDNYTRGDSDISVTQLISPPQMEALKHAHAGEMVEDASDRIWALIGQAVHEVLERSEVPGDRTEERLYKSVNGWTVSGQFDRWSNGVLRDYKITSVWSVKDALLNGKKEWTDQLTLLAALCDHNDLHTDRAEIIAICRDWSQYGIRRDPDYPPQCARIPVQIHADRWGFLEQRVALHQAAREGDYPPCTASEMWERPTTYAVMKRGRKSALRVLDTHQDAEKWMQEKGYSISDEYTIVERLGERIRCEGYCPVSDICGQHEAYRAAQGR